MTKPAPREKQLDMFIPEDELPKETAPVVPEPPKEELAAAPPDEKQREIKLPPPDDDHEDPWEALGYRRK